MTMRERIVQQALSLVGTPWHHRAMLPGVGIDCVRSLEWVAKQCGLLPATWEPPEYSPEWNLHQNQEMLLEFLAELGCAPVALDARQPGDAMAFQYGRVSAHMGVLVACDPDYLVHAAADRGRVVHHRLSGGLLARIRGIYAFPGVEVVR